MLAITSGVVAPPEFPGLTEARAWYDSPAYRAILHLRTGHIEGDLLLIEGVGPDYDPAERARKLQAEAPSEGRTATPGSRSEALRGERQPATPRGGDLARRRNRAARTDRVGWRPRSRGSHQLLRNDGNLSHSSVTSHRPVTRRP
ncbi:DUF1330 domain-containing protein [Streptomyces sp. NPDC085524]|uniref:DUF1330 domain-containing protein n=1 Tax=unclassified Streptomyces TaxID=2593676 RepID=UPI0035D5B77D